MQLPKVDNFLPVLTALTCMHTLHSHRGMLLVNCNIAARKLDRSLGLQNHMHAHTHAHVQKRMPAYRCTKGTHAHMHTYAHTRTHRCTKIHRHSKDTPQDTHMQTKHTPTHRHKRHTHRHALAETYTYTHARIFDRET